MLKKRKSQIFSGQRRGVHRPKLTEKKRKEFIKDEARDAKKYRHYGLPNLARDESRHKRFLQKKGRKK